MWNSEPVDGLISCGEVGAEVDLAEDSSLLADFAVCSQPCCFVDKVRVGDFFPAEATPLADASFGMPSLAAGFNEAVDSGDETIFKQQGAVLGTGTPGYVTSLIQTGSPKFGQGALFIETAELENGTLNENTPDYMVELDSLVICTAPRFCGGRDKLVGPDYKKKEEREDLLASSEDVVVACRSLAGRGLVAWAGFAGRAGVLACSGLGGSEALAGGACGSADTLACSRVGKKTTPLADHSEPFFSCINIGILCASSKMIQQLNIGPELVRIARQIMNSNCGPPIPNLVNFSDTEHYLVVVPVRKGKGKNKNKGKGKAKGAGKPNRGH